MATIHGFELVRETAIPELRTHARLLRHVRTGAELLSLENDDENKVFGITFRTPPDDSTGVPHILEHAVLAGSRKYPLKEPFVELLKSSVQTFLNAFTFPDKTCYPVASQNLQDFYNLIDVYVDAVFYPLLYEHTFQQEGWHYELEQAGGTLAYKGVVFNEMKGAYASPDRVLGEAAQRSLFPDNTYGVDAGGEPAHILDLTYEQFKDFHARLYHPSNSRIVFYGDDDPDERLRLMDEYLKDFDRLEPDSAVPLQARFDAPKQVRAQYAAGQDSAAGKNGMAVVSWLLGETHDTEYVLGLQILTHILIGMPASPLRKALIDSGLGEDLAGVGLEDGLRQMYFSTGLRGIDVGQAGAVEALVLQTLARLADEGIDPLTVEAAFNTISFQLRENNSGSFPRGIALMIRSLNTWLYEGDPFAPLQFEAPLAAIKARLDGGERYFEELIRHELLDNTHRTTVVLEPDPGVSEREAAVEQARLDQARAGMNDADLERIAAATAELQRIQTTPDSPEALATIPNLKLEDMDRENKLIPLQVQEHDGVKILYHDLFTNGIVYLDLGLDLLHLPEDLLPYTTLFGRSLLEMGTDTEDFVQLSQRIGRTTGGITPQVFTSVVRGSGEPTAWLFLRAKALPEQVDDLLQIFEDTLLNVRLDNQERFRQLVLEEKAMQEARLAPAGHQVVNTRLRSQFNAAAWAAEQIGGISYLFFLRELAQQIDADWPAVLAHLEQIRDRLVSRPALLGNVTLDGDNWQAVQPKLQSFLSRLPSGEAQPVEWSPEYLRRSEGLSFPAKVNYVGKAGDLYGLGYTFDGSAMVIARYLNSTWLWERVRVHGGAYGGFCGFDHRSGVWTYVSYRDPNLLATLEVYKGAGEFLRTLELSDAELQRAVVGAVGDLDTYQLPDAKGFTSLQRYLAGDTDEDRQRMREQMLTTTADDFRAFGDVLDRIDNQAPVVVLGSHAGITAANAERSAALEIVEVLPDA